MTPLRGSFVALATPLRGDEVDVDAYRALIRLQIGNGTAGLVPIGTTGEYATLTQEERNLLIRTAVESAAGRVPVIAGAGTNSTRTTIESVARAREQGADAALIVTPYYNKPVAAGLVAHFAAIAKAHPGFPIIAYNVPSRTGCDLTPEVWRRLCDIPEIIGIKEATGSMARLLELKEKGGREGLSFLSGDDFTIAPFIAAGGSGVISVSANIAPRVIADLCALSLAHDFAKAAAMQAMLVPLHNALFSESNPIPVKAALHMAGLFADELRLPLTPMSDAPRAKLAEAMRALRLLPVLH